MLQDADVRRFPMKIRGSGGRIGAQCIFGDEQFCCKLFHSIFAEVVKVSYESVWKGLLGPRAVFVASAQRIHARQG